MSGADAALEAVSDRIATVRERLTIPDGLAPMTVHFEVQGEPYELLTDGGVPVRLQPASGPAAWSVVVDDWDLVVPLGEARPLTELRSTGVRIAETLHAHPLVHEVDSYGPDLFPEVLGGTLLCLYTEHHGTPVGSVRFSTIFRDGLPEYAGDVADKDIAMPKVALGMEWRRYWEYRRGRFHQLEMLVDGWFDGNWKDLLGMHGLYDAEGFRRAHANYPELPAELISYSHVLSDASRTEPVESPPEPQES